MHAGRQGEHTTSALSVAGPDRAMVPHLSAQLLQLPAGMQTALLQLPHAAAERQGLLVHRAPAAFQHRYLLLVLLHSPSQAVKKKKTLLHTDDNRKRRRREVDQRFVYLLLSLSALFTKSLSSWFEAWMDSFSRASSSSSLLRSRVSFRCWSRS